MLGLYTLHKSCQNHMPQYWTHKVLMVHIITLFSSLQSWLWMWATFLKQFGHAIENQDVIDVDMVTKHSVLPSMLILQECVHAF